MLLNMSDAKLNKTCGLRLSEQYSLGKPILYPEKIINEDSKLYIIDVACDKNIHFTTTAEAFANQLIEMGLPSSMQDIYLIMSDLNPDRSLIVFCNNLAKAFSEHHQRKIVVHAPSELGYDITLLALGESNQWQIHGINDDGIITNQILQEKTGVNLEYINALNTDEKVLVWEGKDIERYLNDPQKTYDGISYVWSS